MKDKELKDIIDRELSVIEGENWFGDSFKDKLEGLTEEMAFKKPLPEIHSVAELISHLTVWKVENIEKLKGRPAILSMESPENWKSNDVLKEFGWEALKEQFYLASNRLTALLEGEDDRFLEKIGTSDGCSHRVILEGLIQHDVYHLGQIGVTIKLVKSRE